MKNFKINNLSRQAILIITLIVIVQSVSAQNSFSTSSTAFTGFTNSSMAIADIDGDNDQDVLICGNVSSVATTELYTNDGSGNFTKVNGTPFPNLYGDLAFGDIDGDNDQDVIMMGVTPSFQEVIELYTNDGSGNFTKVNGTPFLGGFQAQVAFIDADGDTDQDVLIMGSTLFNSNVSKLYLNNGSGTYTASTSLLHCKIKDLEIGDIDGDNDLDFYMIGTNNGNAPASNFYVNDGSGNFTKKTTSIFEPVEGDAILIDTDGDNDLDLVMNGENGLSLEKKSLYINDGSGAFTLVNGTPFSSLSGNTFLNNFAVTAGDIDNDNDLDLFFGVGDAGGVYINGGNNNFYLDNTISLTYEFKDAILFDANGDNKLDLITSGNEITKLYNNTYASANSQKSLDFDGTNIYTAPHEAALNTLPMTVEFWINISGGVTQGILDKFSANNGFQIMMIGGKMVSIYQPSVGNSTEINQIFTVNDGTWHHVAFVIENTGTKIYGDGVLLGTSTWTGTAAAISNTADLRLGRATNTTVKSTGALDEVRFWNSARTATEIRQNMYIPIANPATNANLVAYYTMNEYINNTYFIDQSSHGNALTIEAGNITFGSELINYNSAATNVNSSVQNTTSTIGNLTFDDATANGNDPFDAATEIVVAKVTGAPNATTGISETNTDNKYYIVQLYNGAGTYSVDLSIDSPFPNGSSVSLYRRDDHSTGAWTLLSSGTVVGGKAVFNNISSFSQLMMASSAALPVELLSFSASAKSESIQLDWTVGVEDNLSHYEIERSTDGRDFVPNSSSLSWKNIGSISAKALSFYEFEDYNVYKNETYYYRLKAIDFDESYEYSSIVHATMKQLNTETVKLFPNPVTDGIVNINIEGENAYISLHDQTGRMIRNYQPTENNFQVNISDLPNGMYYATIMIDGLHTVKKFIKQ